MWGLDALGIEYNAANSIVTLPVWAAAVAAGLILVLFVLALVRTGLAGTMVFLALIGFGGWAAWSWTDYAKAGERRALEARMQTIETQAQASGALACLDAAGGEALDAACERAVFGSAETAAAATSYAHSQLNLLADGLRYAMQDGEFAKSLEPMRLSLERDRFGVVAHALVQRRGCTPDKCDQLANFKNPAQIRTNIRDNAFGTRVTRAAANWQERNERTASSAAPTTAMTSQPSGQPLPPGYNLPSASSIPPVSIMAAEPATPPAPAAAPPPARTAAPRRPPAERPPPQPRRQTESRQSDGGPVQILPPPPRTQ
jgi:hypothetical protein